MVSYMLKRPLMLLSSAEKDLQAHLHGRKHLRGLDKLKAFEKSVFIRGFPGTTSSDTLQKFLEEEVGGVNSVYLKAPPNVSFTGS